MYGEECIKLLQRNLFLLIYEIGGAEGNTNTNATTPINSGSITPESSKTLNPPEGSIIPETEPTSLTEEETTPQAGNQDPSKGIMMLKT